MESLITSVSSTLVQPSGNGGNVQVQDNEYLAVRDLNIVFMKMQALLSSFAYVSIDNPEWFNLQVADTTIGVLRDKIMSKGDDSPACLQFFKHAYYETMRHWQTALVV